MGPADGRLLGRSDGNEFGLGDGFREGAMLGIPVGEVSVGPADGGALGDSDLNRVSFGDGIAVKDPGDPVGKIRDGELLGRLIDEWAFEGLTDNTEGLLVGVSFSSMVTLTGATTDSVDVSVSPSVPASALLLGATSVYVA